MATAPDQTRNESLVSGADAVIESLVRNGVEPARKLCRALLVPRVASRGKVGAHYQDVLLCGLDPYCASSSLYALRGGQRSC